CVSCGACVESCPTGALTDKSLIQLGQPTKATTTTCAYFGVVLPFNAEAHDGTVVDIVPNGARALQSERDYVQARSTVAAARHYATQCAGITTPMSRKWIDASWQQVSWDEAINYAASEFKRIQAKYGRDSIGGITSSRCTNEETFLVQKMVRAAFGNNNVDTCA